MYVPDFHDRTTSGGFERFRRCTELLSAHCVRKLIIREKNCTTKLQKKFHLPWPMPQKEFVFPQNTNSCCSGLKKNSQRKVLISIFEVGTQCRMTVRCLTRKQKRAVKVVHSTHSNCLIFFDAQCRHNNK